MNPKQLFDMIKMLRPFIVWSKFEYVRRKIDELSNEFRHTRLELIQAYEKAVIEKNCHELRYDVMGGQNPKDVIANIKRDNWQNGVRRQFKS